MSQFQTDRQPGVRPLHPQGQAQAQILAFEKSARVGARWFYWIAGLSAVNLAMFLSGSGGFFVVGLGIPMILGVLLKSSGLHAAAIGVNVIVLGFFAAFGYFATRGHLWAFIVGMVLYLCDGLVFIFAKDWMSIGFHAFVLFCLFSGVRALLRSRALRLAAIKAAMPIPQLPNNQGQWQ